MDYSFQLLGLGLIIVIFGTMIGILLEKILDELKALREELGKAVQGEADKKEAHGTGKCPKCGANVETMRFHDGQVLTRRDCQCELGEDGEGEDGKP